MRNLKRALSLTLASVMLLGMMVVGSSAAGYPDVTEEENIEAIEVLQSVGVMEGDNNGNFNPDDYVTREQMAVIMSKLLNLDYNYYQGTNPFSDVPAWAAPYVAACAANGITSGIGNGMYGAGQNVNAVQAALMMLKALGYFQYQQDFGDDYVLATVKQATEIGLFKLIDSKAEQALTRNEVAQMALNALQSDLVRFTGDPGVEYTGSNGESWIGGYKSEYTPRTSTDPKYNRLIDNKHSSNIDSSGQYYCQLGEELYNGNLVKRIDSDIFERPSYTWTYKTEKIGTYMDREKLQATYTKGVTGRDLYDLLNNITIRDYDLEVYVDGHEADNSTGTTATDYTQYKYTNGGTDEVITGADMKRSNTDNVGITGDGVLTQVFLDRDNEVITITSIHTWLAQATSTYSETKENATLKVHMYYTAKSNGSLDLVSATKTAHVEDVPEVEGVVNETFYRVQMSDKDTSKLEIVAIDEPEILAESTITKFSLGTKFSKGQDGLKYPTKITVDGTEYNDSDRACYDVDVLDQYDQNLLTSNTYNVYLDQYGYFLGLDLHEGTKQYVFVTGYDMRNSNLAIKTAEASAIFLDGTMDTITVNVKDTNENIENMVEKKTASDDAGSLLTTQEKANSQAYYKQWKAYDSDGVYLLNRWYTYTENNGVYTLKPCVDKNGVAMMLASKTDDVTTGDASELKMNCSKLRLDSVTDSGDARDGDLLMGEEMKYTKGTGTGAGKILSEVRAYGEDASVFITVDVDDVSAKLATGLDATKAITDVNGVYTGVQDVDLVTKTSNRVVGNYYTNNAENGTAAGEKSTAANDTWKTDATADLSGHYVASTTAGYSYVGENAYAVFDKDNFIIGAVILGEAEGNNATKAYILDPVKYERYSDGTYYWQFEAVINGEIVTQEAESKYASTIDTMRNNQYEIVELRYNAAGDVVTDVKEIARTDGALVAPTYGADKIYGYPFNEIVTKSALNPAGHKVNDDESIYDVVLTGASDKATVNFTYVTRPRTSDNLEHGTATNQFNTTALGTLRLQGRTLYVLDGQHDYGIDFIRDAKAVVRQREGYVDSNGVAHSEWKNRAYSSVQEAIDSLGDDNKLTGEKEYRGIITAVLNSNGVAEWVVFYSDVVAETKSDTGIGQATIDVEIRTQLPGGKAEFYEIRKVARPTDGTDIAEIVAPDLSAKGFEPKQDPMYLLWKKYDERPIITFEYTKDGVTPEDPNAETFAVRVAYATAANYATGAGADRIGDFEEIKVPLSASGYGTLDSKLLKKIPAGYEIDTTASNTGGGKNTDLGDEVDSNASTPKRTLVVAVKGMADTTITGIKLHSAATVNWAKLGNAPTGVKFDITYPNGTVENVSATTASTAITVADDTTTTWTKDGDGKVTINGKTCTVPVKIYADVDTTVVAASGGDLDDWTVAATASQDTKSGKATITLTQKDKNLAALTETEAKAIVGRLKGNGAEDGITVTGFAYKSFTAGKAETSGGADDGVAGVITVEVTFTGTPTADPAGLKIDINA